MMNNFQEYCFYGMAALAVFDRFILKRKKIRLVECGDAVVRGKALAFPLRFRVSCARLTGAMVEYSLRDSKNPTSVITGKTRTLDLSAKGINEEYLLIDQRYLEAGTWLLSVRVTHGNSRMNPLYRIFPVQESITRNYGVTKDDQGVFSVIN